MAFFDDAVTIIFNLQFTILIKRINELEILKDFFMNDYKKFNFNFDLY